MKIVATLAAAMLLSGTTAAENINGPHDFYQGTLIIENKQLFLKRCDGAQHQYYLTDHNNITVINRLITEIENLEQPVSAMIFGDYESNNQENITRLTACDEISAGKSCHLFDMLQLLSK